MPASSPMAGADGALSPAGPGAIFDGLAQRRMVVVSGKGGVGRTTLSALTGLAIAQRGRRVLVCTTGHDDRLAWMLGAEALHDQPTVVAPGLSIVRLVPQTCIREYGGLVMHSQRISHAVFDNRVVKRLLRAIPGLDDFALIGKAWHEAIRGTDYDTVIYDGPATGHLIYTLGVPQAVLKAVPPGPLTKEAQLMQSSFEDASKVQAMLVGLPELWPLTELGELGGALEQKIRMHVATIVVNGIWPAAVPALEATASGDADRVGAFAREVSRIGAAGRQQHHEVETWARGDVARSCGAASWTTLPWQWGGIRDLAGTQAMLSAIDPASARAQGAG